MSGEPSAEDLILGNVAAAPAIAMMDESGEISIDLGEDFYEIFLSGRPKPKGKVRVQLCVLCEALGVSQHRPRVFSVETPSFFVPLEPSSHKYELCVAQAKAILGLR